MAVPQGGSQHFSRHIRGANLTALYTAESAGRILYFPAG